MKARQNAKKPSSSDAAQALKAGKRKDAEQQFLRSSLRDAEIKQLSSWLSSKHQTVDAELVDEAEAQIRRQERTGPLQVRLHNITLSLFRSACDTTALLHATARDNTPIPRHAGERRRALLAGATV